MSDIGLPPLLQRVPKLKVKPNGRGLIKQQAIQDIIKSAGPPLLEAAIGPSGSGFFRNFLYANPPFATTAVHSSLRMARPRVRVSKTQRYRRRRNVKRTRKRTKRSYLRRRICRKKIVTRILQEYDGSANKPAPPGFINILYPNGGLHKFIFSTRLLQNKTKQIGDDYTHYKVLHYLRRIVPETVDEPTIDETAKQDTKSIPYYFKSYHMGLTVTKGLK